MSTTTARTPTTDQAAVDFERNDRHAVVIGAGMAGLWAGRILSDYFGRVTIIDRDRFPEQPARRKGVPQARHAHTLLARGQRVLEGLFPNLDTELAAAGAPRIDWTQDCLSFFRTGWVRRYRSGLVTRTCSRDLLEWSVRRAMAGIGTVRFLEEREVTGLIFDKQADCVTGMHLRGRRQSSEEDGDDETVLADLVVDASGRDSRTPEWLEALGFGRVRETVVNPFLGYASRLYRRPPELAADWRAMVVSNVPPDQPRGGVIYPIEDGCWLVTLAGIARDYPPTDEAGFLDFAQRLATPTLYEAIRAAEPLSPVWGYRRTENRLRHYEWLPR